MSYPQPVLHQTYLESLRTLARQRLSLLHILRLTLLKIRIRLGGYHDDQAAV